MELSKLLHVNAPLACDQDFEADVPPSECLTRNSLIDRLCGLRGVTEQEKFCKVPSFVFSARPALQAYHHPLSALRCLGEDRASLPLPVCSDRHILDERTFDPTKEVRISQPTLVPPS